MRKYFLPVIGLVVGITMYMASTANAGETDSTVTFKQIRPYIACLVYVDSATNQMRICDPRMKKVRIRLMRRNLTNLPLLTTLHRAYLNLLMQSTAEDDSSSPEIQTSAWTMAQFAAGDQAMNELSEVKIDIEDRRDYLDLLDIRISQILAKNADFLEPLLAELEKFLVAGESSLNCVDCKEKFAEWLQNVRPDSLHGGQ